MDAFGSTPDAASLNWKPAVGLLAAAVAAFHLAYGFRACSPLIALFVGGVVALARLGTARRAFYIGFAAGMLVYGPQLWFFFTIFGPAAAALWAVLAFWLGLFVLLAREAVTRLPGTWAAWLIAFLWAGLEYFRSELYFLRFAWLTPGLALSELPQWAGLPQLGAYGLGFALAAAASFFTLVGRMGGALWLAVPLLLGGFNQFNADGAKAAPPLPVAGAQLEFPDADEVTKALDALLKKHPQTELLVLSEYTFTGPVPASVKDWSRANRRHLIVGGKDPLPDDRFYNTAFVVGPAGEIVFRQVKAVPIQFFADGLPAPEQRLWDSPWGKLGLCICYDLAYTRVTDRLVRLGAQAIIAPTMDVAEWGAREHELHARIARARAAEYAVPVFRVASSGVSQLVDARGRELASAPFPGQGEEIAGTLALARRGGMPWDRFLAPVAVVVTAAWIGWLAWLAWRKKFRAKASL